MRYRFHLIPNAHLDPVWLWDWREGLNEGMVTCRTVLDLMDEDPDLTFIRGEAAVYRHIEKYDPETFSRIRAMVVADRWDSVGGTVIQPDTNLPATEVFLRQFLDGSGYLHDSFGVRPTVAWAADSFGHSAGMPDILTAAGMESFAFTRPFEGNSSAFWWEGKGGGRVLAWRPPVGWYGAERDEMPRRLDGLLNAARDAGFRNVAVLFGVGNHGGGPTRRQLAEIRAWANTNVSEVELVHSGLHRFFRELRSEITDRNIPTHHGELNYCLRGCYSSVARFKFRYREAERSLARAQNLTSAVSLANGVGILEEPRAWETLLFNAFHDILPGTSIERAMDDQVAQLGGVVDSARRMELDAVNALAAAADTTVPKAYGDNPGALAFLVVNPEPVPVTHHVEFEGCLDYRPLFAYSGRVAQVPSVLRGPDGCVLASQRIRVENRFGNENLPWRDRHVARVELPAFGWSVFTLGLEEFPRDAPKGSVETVGSSGLDNGMVGVRVDVGTGDIGLAWGGVRRRLRVLSVEDPYGSWGAMDEAPVSLDLQTVRHRWMVTTTHVLEPGPLRGRLWVRLEGGSSRIDLTFTVDDGEGSVGVDARVLWNESAARLKLEVEADAPCADYDVPGGVACRPAGAGEVPGGRWAVAGDLIWATDSLYGWNLTSTGQLQATVCRASRYAADSSISEGESPWEPSVDCGELKFSMRFANGSQDPRNVSRELERGLLVQRVAPSSGSSGRSGAIGTWNADGCELLSVKRSRDRAGWVVRWHNRSGRDARPAISLGGSRLELPVPAGKIQSFRLTSSAFGWDVSLCDARES